MLWLRGWEHEKEKVFISQCLQAFCLTLDEEFISKAFQRLILDDKGNFMFPATMRMPKD